MSSQGWDDVVVGAGASGAVVASRLARQPGRRVLLLEAGPDEPEPQRPGQPLGGHVTGDHHWNYSAYVGSEASGKRFPYRLGKVVGGSSAVNGAIALRGLSFDFDAWAAAGNDRWTWNQVLPWFREIETDQDLSGPDHGNAGVVPIRRPGPDETDAIADGFVRACGTLGLPKLDDLNAGAETGVGLVPANRLGWRRMSTAETHLAPEHRGGQLTIWDRSSVTRVILRGQRVTGLEAVRDGRIHQLAADRVVLCAGAVNTPVILQRSGIGDGRRLTHLGIRTVIDLPGVGANLTDHPVVAFWSEVRPETGRLSAISHQVMARAASTSDAPDLSLFLGGNIATDRIPVIGAALGGRRAIVVSAMLGAPVSRGAVRLRDAMPASEPDIVLSLATEAADMDQLIHGSRLAWSVLTSPAMAELVHPALLWTNRMLAEDALLRSALARFVSPMCHPVGTARMGPAGDTGAVVDQSMRVHGSDGLWVVDASVMPTITSAPTSLTCVMLAERAARWIG